MGTTAQTNSELIITHDLKPGIIVLRSEQRERVNGLIIQAEALRVSDPKTLGLAEAVFTEIKALNKEISTARLEVTRPLDDLKKRIIAAEREATEPLEKQEKRLAQEVVAYRREVDRLRQEEERRIRLEREAAERKAREESERRRREAEEAAAEEAALFGESVTVAPIIDEPAPVFIPERIPATPDLGKSAVRTTKRRVLQVNDRSRVLLAIARDIVAANAEKRQPMLAQAVKIDDKALLDLLKAGVPIDGASIVEAESFGSAGK